MHTSARNLALVGLSVLLIAALIAFVLTRQTVNPEPLKHQAGNTEAAPAKLVDQSPLETAHSLSSVPSTAEEQRLASEAVRIADHEVDIAFASALQNAQLHPPAENGETKELNARILFLDNRLQQVQAEVSQANEARGQSGQK